MPPNVLKTIINEGSYADDAVAVEYFGGVLASSRTEVSRDERGTPIAKMFDCKSAYQMRTHYSICSTTSELFSDGANSFYISEDRSKMQLFMPLQGYAEAMDFKQREWDNPQILNHISNGLSADGLIQDGWGFGSLEELRTLCDNVPGDGIVSAPPLQGVELFLWAFGNGDKELNFSLKRDFSSIIEEIPNSVPMAVATEDIAD